MDQRDSHCPYLLSSELTAKPTVLGLLVCNHFRCHTILLFSTRFFCFLQQTLLRATAGQEDPFELDSNLLLSSGRHGEDRKRQYFLYDHETPLLDDLADLLYNRGIASTLYYKLTCTLPILVA